MEPTKNPPSFREELSAGRISVSSFSCSSLVSGMEPTKNPPSFRKEYAMFLQKPIMVYGVWPIVLGYFVNHLSGWATTAGTKTSGVIPFLPYMVVSVVMCVISGVWWCLRLQRHQRLSQGIQMTQAVQSHTISVSDDAALPLESGVQGRQDAAEDNTIGASARRNPNQDLQADSSILSPSSDCEHSDRNESSERCSCRHGPAERIGSGGHEMMNGDLSNKHVSTGSSLHGVALPGIQMAQAVPRYTISVSDDATLPLESGVQGRQDAFNNSSRTEDNSIGGSTRRNLDQDLQADSSILSPSSDCQHSDQSQSPERCSCRHGPAERIGGGGHEMLNVDFSNDHVSTGSSLHGVSDLAPASSSPHAIIGRNSGPQLLSSMLLITEEEDISRLAEVLRFRLREGLNNPGRCFFLVNVLNNNDILELLVNNNVILELLVEMLKPGSNLHGSSILHKRIDIGQTGHWWKDFLSSEVIEYMKLAKTYDKDCTMQLGSVAVLKYTDAGLKCWMLQKDSTPVILDLHRSRRSFLHLLNDERPKWTVRGFNLEKAILRVATTKRGRDLTILNYSKIDDGVEELSFQEPRSFRMFSNEVYIVASNPVQLEGVTSKLYSEATKVQGAFWISVLDSLIPILWTGFLIASLLLVGGFAFPTRNEFFTAGWFAVGFPIGYSVFLLLLREFAPLEDIDVDPNNGSTISSEDRSNTVTITPSPAMRNREEEDIDVDPNHGSKISSEDRRNTISVTPSPAMRNLEEEDVDVYLNHGSTISLEDTSNTIAITTSPGRRNGEEEGKETVFGKDNAQTPSTLHNLGALYIDQAEEGEMYNHALEGRKKVLGKDHPSTLETMHNLGTLNQDQRKLVESKELHMNALSGKKRAFGNDITLTLSTTHHPRALYEHEGKVAATEQMLQGGLGRSEKSFGKDDLSTLETIINLGALYQDQEKLTTTEVTLNHALARREKLFGKNHPSTLDTLHNLSTLYKDQGKLEEAKQMLKRALAGRRKTLGKNHPSTLEAMHNLGALYQDQGKLAEAEEMYMHVLVEKERALGNENASTLSSVDHLGALYRDQGKLEEAEQMLNRAFAGREKSLGIDHPLTLQSVHNLGALYQDQGKLGAAEEMLKRALAGREKSLGKSHPSTLETAHNLGALYQDQGKLAEAEEMYMLDLVGKERALGNDNASTLSSVDHLGA